MSELIANRYKNKYVIVRSYGAGAFSGVLYEYDPQTGSAILKNGRHLWYFKGFTLKAVANEGIVDNEGKLSQTFAESLVAQVIEIIPCTEIAAENLINYPVHDPLNTKKKGWNMSVIIEKINDWFEIK